MNNKFARLISSTDKQTSASLFCAMQSETASIVGHANGSSVLSVVLMFIWIYSYLKKAIVILSDPPSHSFAF